MTTLAAPTRSAFDFSDPVHRAAVAPIGNYRKCSYLLALAAWQRGLTVEFFGSQADARVNIRNMPAQRPRPELFQVSDGQRRHFFCLSMGDRTTPNASALARSKKQAKKHFLKAGVRTPRAAIWTGHNMAEIQRFVGALPDKTFVLKPEVGSLRSGVMVRLPASQVIRQLSKIGPSVTLVEEHIEGVEHRIYVVAGQVVAAHIKPGVSVTGNGRDSIATLIQRKNDLRLADPPLASYLIDAAAAAQYLAGFGQSMSRVPVLAERVILGPSCNLADGGDAYSVMDTLDADVARQSLAACAAISLPNGAVDVILDGAQAYVLEVNACAGIAAHSFPTIGPAAGNLVAEAIIDWYFPTPDSAPPRRHAGVLDCHDLYDAFEKHGAKTRFKLAPLPDLT